jgi:serine phosphatase RsbU (regulator of sigma subunit)
VRRLEEENRLKYEMDLLTRMQLGLLPQETPKVAGLEIAARSILATEAGGDLYDFIHDERGRLWIAAGDVSGHGYSCAIAQAMTKAGLASLVEADRTPSAVLERLDRVLRGMSTPRTFTTLLLLRIDPATGETLVSNAGHPYPLLASHGTTTRELELPSLPLGQGPLRRYEDATVMIESGTTLVLSSDGLFEATDVNGESYGFERVHSLLPTLCRRPAAAILDAIVEHWRTHAGTSAPDDDTTLVVIKRI